MEDLLIALADILQYRQIDKQINTDSLNGHILSAQRTNLLPLLGTGFYYAVVNDVVTYANLINGNITYTDSDGETALYFGLKPFLVFHTLGYLLNDNNLKIADAGNLNLLDTTFQKATGGETKGAKDDYLNQANFYYNNIVDYLDQNISTYPLWDRKNERGQTEFEMQII